MFRTQNYTIFPSFAKKRLYLCPVTTTYMAARLTGFDNQKYLTIQSEKIRERISRFDGKLYMEFGGKLADDYHASRVLPGFEPDSKLMMLEQLKDMAEILIVISALDIEKNKMRSDYGITYDEDVLRLREEFLDRGFKADSVVITHFNGQESAAAYKERLEREGIGVYYLYNIADYPNNVPLIDSDEGFGRNDFVPTSRPLVVVTAPGPGSGKMVTCLSQLYNEFKRGRKAGYAKFETFPVWDLPLSHPVHLAYEAATADLDDVNMIDPFHLEAYGKTAVNYNRDIESFPVLQAIFEGIYGESPYKSPTDMGVNTISQCISDDDVCRNASLQEIIRRYFAALDAFAIGKGTEKEVNKLTRLMRKCGLEPEDRPVVAAARAKKLKTGLSSAAIELQDGKILTAKAIPLLGSSASLLLNATKYLAGIPREVKLIPAEAIAPIQRTKVSFLGGHNPRLHTDEVLIALSMQSSRDENCRRALDQLPRLRGCQVHTTEILNQVDIDLFRKLGVDLTSEPIRKKKKRR